MYTSAGPPLGDQASGQPWVGWKRSMESSSSGQLLSKMCQCREDTGRLQSLHSIAGPNRAFLKHLAQAVHAIHLFCTRACDVKMRASSGSQFLQSSLLQARCYLQFWELSSFQQPKLSQDTSVCLLRCHSRRACAEFKGLMLSMIIWWQSHLRLCSCGLAAFPMLLTGSPRCF